jgi:hypothetical protein
VGSYNTCKALAAHVQHPDPSDVWTNSPISPTHTYCTAQAASRADRIYTSRNLIKYKKGAETLVASFTDHLAVVLKIAFDLKEYKEGGNSGKGEMKE